MMIFCSVCREYRYTTDPGWADDPAPVCDGCQDPDLDLARDDAEMRAQEEIAR